MTRFLITGGAGYIGSVITKMLLDRGDKTLVVDNLSTGIESRIDSRALFENCDIRHSDLILNIIRTYRPEVVIHCAALTSVLESNEDPSSYYKVNLGGTINLLAALHDLGGVRFLFSSTAAVYADCAKSVDENSAIGPSSVYGHSKLLAEQVSSKFAVSQSIKVANLRYFNVVGSGCDNTIGKFDSVDLFTNFCAKFYEQKKVEIYGNSHSTRDGFPIRDFIHVEDLALAHLGIADYLTGDCDFHQIINIGYGRGISVMDVYRAFKKLTGFDVGWIVMPARKGEISYSVADNSKLRSMQIWAPKYDSAESLVESAWNYYLSYRNRGF